MGKVELYKTNTIENSQDIFQEFMNINEYLGKLVTDPTHGFRIFREYGRKSLGSRTRKNFNKSLSSIKQIARTCRMVECYLGLLKHYSDMISWDRISS